VLSLSASLPAAVAPSASRRAIESENHAAAALPPMTVQALFAANVRQSLEAGPSALLPFDRRRRLLVAATKLGVRPFDANLIIALVQDQARRDHESDSIPIIEHLRPAPAAGKNPVVPLAVALLLGLVMGLLVALWILSASR
jgi:hypothetical protein